MRRLVVLAGLMGCAVWAQTPDAKTQQDVVNARIQAAETALEKQDYAGAAKTLKQLAVERPKDARVLYDLGFADERIGDDDGAATAYAGAIGADATMAEPQVALGLLDARAGRRDKAHDELKQAAGLAGATPALRGRALRALAALDQDAQPALAADELVEAVKLTGETSADVLMGADLAAKAGKDADAEAAYRRALAMEPGDLDVVAGLAHSLIRQQKYAEAEAVLVEPAKAHPEDPRLVSQLATTYADEDKAALAIPLVVSLREKNKALANDAGISRLLARLYAMDGQNQAAEDLYRPLAMANPTDAELLDDWGGVLVKLQQYAKAEATFSRAVAQRDQFATPQEWATAAEHLAFAASKNADPKMALQALAARATVLPNSPASLFLEAISHDTLRETKAAIVAYRAFLAIANGKFPDEEFQARHRLIALEHQK